jgi:hypothetical protein
MICTNVDDYAIFTNDSSWHDNFIKLEMFNFSKSYEKKKNHYYS